MKKNKDSFKKYFEDYDKAYASMNEYAIWVFIAMLGCWKVPDRNLQIIGVILVYVLFLYKSLPVILASNKTLSRKRYVDIKKSYNAASFTQKRKRLIFLRTLSPAWKVFVFLFSWGFTNAVAIRIFFNP
jgi:hypothetical protein